MARTYSNDLGDRALDLLGKGMTKAAVGDALKISVSTLKNWQRTLRMEGRRTVKEGYQKGHSHKITDIDAFKKIMAENPDKILKEIGKILPVPCGKSTVWSTLHRRAGYTFKKRIAL